MKSILIFLISVYLVPLSLSGQYSKTPTSNLGDIAPDLHFKTWLKGTPIQELKTGQIYVMEFWATWCKPCILMMPHMSNLARKYQNRATFISIDVMERKEFTPLEKVQRFVDSMGKNMDYSVAADDKELMFKNWLVGTGNYGIPTSFIVDENGRLAWCGHPKDIEPVLTDVLNHTWDISKALNARNKNKNLILLDDSIRLELMRYVSVKDQGNVGEPAASALVAIGKYVKDEPNIQYAPWVAQTTFSALIKTNINKALAYGKMALAAVSYTPQGYPIYDVIIDRIDYHSRKMSLPPDMYRLGAEAYAIKIEAFPEDVFTDYYRKYSPKFYSKMAEWYRKANDIAAAITAQQKAIEVLKKQPDLSAGLLVGYEAKLSEYKHAQ